MPDFQIQIERLTHEPDRFEFEASGEWWVDRESKTQDPELTAHDRQLTAQDVHCEVEVPFRFALVASRARDDVLIEGEITGRVGVECSRCARRYPHALHDTFRLVLNPAKGLEPTDPEGAQGLSQNGLCLGEDLEAGSYRGPVIRLDDFFGEVIALAMPIQPLCDQACLGICSHCGLDRNGRDRHPQAKGPEAGVGCDCEDEKIESPFAVLASLKGDLRSGDEGGGD